MGGEKYLGFDDMQSFSNLHYSIARELKRLHQETVELQSSIGKEFETSRHVHDGLFELQVLDRQAQRLDDLSRLMAQMGADLSDARFQDGRLRNVCQLASTVAAIFEAPTQLPSEQTLQGDVTIF